MDESENKPKKVIIVRKKQHLKSLDEILSQALVKKSKPENFDEANSSLYNPVFNKTDKLKEKLLEANQYLVYKYANHFYRLYKNKISALELEDLISAGNLGLLKAIEKFNPKLENSFSTYAVFWIKQVIIRDVYENLGMTKFPVHLIEKIHKYNTGYYSISEQDKNTIELAKYYFGNLFSLDKLIGNDEFDTSIKDLTSSYNRYTPQNIALYYKPEYEYELKEFSERVKEVLGLRVNQRFLKMFMLRYGLEDGLPKTLEEVGDEIGVTRERVRQVCAKCLKKLRESKQFSLADYSIFEVNYD